MPIDPTLQVPAPRQARSVETRRRLLEAAIACLIERGFASTTTAHVCQQAGVSQGALFKHFPTKAALWVACVEQLFSELMGDFHTVFQTVLGEADRVGAAVRLLDRCFREPRFHAAIDLFLVSRHDSALREALEPVVVAFRESLRDEASCDLRKRNHFFSSECNSNLRMVATIALMLGRRTPLVVCVA